MVGIERGRIVESFVRKPGSLNIVDRRFDSCKERVFANARGRGVDRGRTWVFLCRAALGGLAGRPCSGRLTRRQAKDLGGSDGPAVVAGVLGEGGSIGGAARYRAGQTRLSGYEAIAAEQQDWLEQQEPLHGG